jgi:hypothetical protein
LVDTGRSYFGGRPPPPKKKKKRRLEKEAPE